VRSFVVVLRCNEADERTAIRKSHYGAYQQHSFFGTNRQSSSPRAKRFLVGIVVPRFVVVNGMAPNPHRM